MSELLRGFFIFATFLATALTPSFTQSFEWAKAGGGLEIDIAESAVSDQNGNVYVTGYISGNATIAGSQVVNERQNVFLAKFSSTGALAWKIIGKCDGNSYGTALAVYKDQFLYLIGHFDYNFTLDKHSLTSIGGSSDIFIFKIDLNGNSIWARQVGGTGREKGYGVTTDNTGNCLLVGEFTGSLSGSNLTSKGNSDLVLGKFDPQGTRSWLVQAGGLKYDGGTGITADDNANIYVVGSYQGDASFESKTISNTGNADCFVAKYNSLGELAWVNQCITKSYSTSTGISVSSSGLYIVGSFDDTLKINDGQAKSNGSRDILISKFDLDGKLVTLRNIGGKDLDYGDAILSEKDRDVWLTGSFDKRIWLGPDTLTSTGGSSMYLIKMDKDLNWKWATAIGRRGTGVSQDPTGNILLSGYYAGQTAFGKDTLTSEVDQLGNPNINFFVSKLSDPISTSVRMGSYAQERTRNLRNNTTLIYFDAFLFNLKGQRKYFHPGRSQEKILPPK